MLNNNGKIFKVLKINKEKKKKENKGSDSINVLFKVKCTSKLGPGIFIKTLAFYF